MATLSELYKRVDIEEDQLGVLAKAVICAKLGCRTDGQEVVFGSHVLRLTDSLPPRRPEHGRDIYAAKDLQQAKPIEHKNTINASGSPKAPAVGQNRQTPEWGPLMPQPTQKPATATGQRRPTDSKGPQQASSQKIGQKSQPGTKAQPLFPPGQKTQLRQPTPQKSVAEQGALSAHPSRQEVQLRRETNPYATVQKPATSNAPTSERRETQEGVLERPRLDELSTLVAKEAKIDAAAARIVLSNILSYLSAYPSVGILRLIDDIAKKTKADTRVVKAAIEALRSIDVIEVIDNAVVNLKKR